MRWRVRSARAGELVSGVEVFRQLYARVGFGRLVACSRAPVVSHLLEGGYSVFARLRLPLTGRCETGACAPWPGTHCLVAAALALALAALALRASPLARAAAELRASLGPGAGADAWRGVLLANACATWAMAGIIWMARRHPLGLRRSPRAPRPRVDGAAGTWGEVAPTRRAGVPAQVQLVHYPLMAHARADFKVRCRRTQTCFVLSHCHKQSGSGAPIPLDQKPTAVLCIRRAAPCPHPMGQGEHWCARGGGAAGGVGSPAQQADTVARRRPCTTRTYSACPSS